MAFKPFDKSKADKKPGGGISPKGKGVVPKGAAPKGNPFAKAAPFAKGGMVKKAGRGC